MPLLLMVMMVMVCLLGGLPRHLGVAHAAAGEPEGPDCDFALKKIDVNFRGANVNIEYLNVSI